MIALLLGVAALGIQDGKALKGQIVNAAMFKNGYAVIERALPVDGTGDYVLEQIPQASLGTLWFSTSDGVKLTSVINTSVPKAEQSPAQNISDLLALNVGKRVTLYFLGQESVSGTLLGASGSIVRIKNGDTTTVLDRTSVIRLTSPDTLTDSSKVEGAVRGLRFHVEGSAGKIYMLSMEQGMSWQPGYAVTLLEGKKLQVVEKATVVNDLDNLDGIETRFVTGWPNLVFAGDVDPLVSGAATILAGTTPGGFGGGGGGRDTRFMNQAPAAKSDFGMAMMPADLGGMQEEDLFFYRQPNLKLKRGDRGYYIVLDTTAPYDELYTWDIPDFVDNATYRPLPPGPTQEDVWHTIKFTNMSKQPFSTGPASILKNNQIIGQDTMKYASAGGKAELKITKAMDISADQNEEEVTRERGVLKDVYNHATHDLVTLKGTLTMINHKSEEVTVRIRKSVTGDIVSMTPEGKSFKSARGLRDVNSHTDLEWTEKIAPGKTLTVTYSYKVFIRV